MSRETQIEEIVKDFCPLYQEYGSCKQCNQYLDIDDEPCYYGCVANIIIDYDYRKSTVLAEEIFAEIDKIVSRQYNRSLFGIAIDITPDLAELKKKYTEEGK